MTWERETARIWIDDERAPPNDSWKWAKTSNVAIELLCDYDPEQISFDHDLGGNDTTMKVVDYIEKWAEAGLIDKFSWTVHSMNPVGRENIIRAMNRIEEKYWR